MFEQVFEFLRENWMGALIGIAVWMTLTWFRPDWGRGWNRYAGKRSWMMALFALALFGGEAVTVWLEGSRFLAALMGLFTFVVVAMWIRRGQLRDVTTQTTTHRFEG